MSQKERKTTVLPEPHPVSINDLRNVIPPHCFERSYMTSFYYIIQDIILVAICLYIGQYIDSIPLVTLRILAWFVHWFVQGAFMTGLWVIAHECGHGAFSPNLIVNDVVGCLLHTMLFVPYWSWKYSHGQHHSNTDCLERDSVFVPYSENQIKQSDSSFSRTTIMRCLGILRLVTIGWPVYLLLDISGPPTHNNGQWTSHFNPFCKLFNASQRKGVIASDIALLIWCYTLYQLCTITSFVILVKFYFLPLMWVNFWLVTITFLQHTDTDIPRYHQSSWTWLRGALGTMDRDYGIFNILHHHIADTHVLHHIFSKIPHYHAVEASKALINSGLIDDFYLYDNTPFYVALWRSYRDCWFVDEKNDITWFHSCVEHDKSKQE